MSTTITLRSPINDGKIKEITLREPTMKQLRKYGIPVDGSTQSIDFDRAAPMIAELAGIQATFVDELTARDSIDVTAALIRMAAGEEAVTESEAPAEGND